MNPETLEVFKYGIGIVCSILGWSVNRMLRTIDSHETRIETCEKEIIKISAKLETKTQAATA